MKAGVESLGYKVNSRTLSDINDMRQGIYKDFDFVAGEQDEIYWGWEHNPDDRSQKLVHVTGLSHLPTKDGDLVMGCTMGHHQENPNLPVMEAYEFHGYGAMVIDTPGDEVDLVFAGPGEKVKIPSGCIMTLYNLGEGELVTHDFANTYEDNNYSTKDRQKADGPIMAVVKIGHDVEFRVSPKWVGRADGYGVKVPVDYEALTISVPAPETTLDRLCWIATLDTPVKHFGDIGFNVQRAGTDVVLDRNYGARSLVDMVLDGEKPLHRFFNIIE